MDRQSVRQRARRHPLPWSSSLRLRYERERLELQKRLTEQLVSDVFGLYEKSLFVDLKLEASRGNVYCHQLFFAARVPAVWRLLQEIAKYQYCGRKPARDLICIQLPDVEYKELQKFTRSLYSDENSRAAGAALRRKLEGILLVLQQRALLHRSQIRIEKLSHEEEQRVQRLILEQLRLGHLSEKKGNVREVGCRPVGHDTPHPRILHSSTPPENADSCITPTAALVKDIPSQGSVRPKSNPRVATRRSELPTQTMNVTDHPVAGLAQCSPKDGSRSGISNCNSVEDNLDNHGVQTQNGKIPRKGSMTLPKKSPPQDDTSPGAPLSSQESPVFNVCMIKELQTSPMQVSGESLQERLRDKKETSPRGSQRSSYSETTPVADLEQPSGDTVIYSNGDAATSPVGGKGPKEGRPLRYGAMFSTKENAFLHQADMYARQQHQAGPSLSLAKHCLPRKSQSFGAESQDSADLENTSASNSGSEQRLSNLHETSSLEVELPSSHEDNSSSHDSDSSPVGAGQKWQSDNPDGKHVPDARSERNSNWLREQEREGEIPSPPVDPLRPLVRARTFEVLEGAVDGSPCEVRTEPRSRTGRGLKHELSEQSGGSMATNSPKRNRAGQSGGGHERKVSDESVSISFQDGVEDPERLRELERKKGSLIFEHNFQTYSNIPSTNMMTASMMTASLSSESGSVGVTGSLYSSMVDSALLGSIHSLGALEASTADPVPRPASVALPVMHPADDSGVEAPCPSRLPLSLSQRSTEAMEIQQEITEREEATRSPSPDSLSVDMVAQRGAKTASKTGSSWLEGSTASINKEEMDDEEKERDDQDPEGRLGTAAGGSNDPKVERRDFPAEESFGLKTFSGSPRLSRDLSEDTPIVSGGSTLKREKDPTGERKSVAKCERQVSVGSVKDVDSIPLVFGYIGPQDEEEKEKGSQAKGEDIGETSKDKDEEKHQSIFPMFIDLKDIPSPAEEPKPAEKEAAARPKGPSSAVYMYIEADSPSPKARRKRRSESDGAALARTSESQSQEFASLPPVLTAAPDVNRVENATKKVHEKREDHDALKEETKEAREGKEGKEGKEKKGFFMFIEAESSSSKSSSPKSKRRPAAPPAKKRAESAMTRSAPSDSILFSTPDTSRLMTKSVIGREEFIAQPPARKNVSLNDKINESSVSSKDGTFVSGIPRPIHSLRTAKGSSRTVKARSAGQKTDSAGRREASNTRTKDEVTTSEANDLATSRDISLSELGPTQSSSIGEAGPSSKAQGAAEAEEAVSDVSSLLSSLDRSNNPSEQGNAEQKSKLGEDLLRMFLNEINTDVTIQIGEKRIRAHKCILASRCVYFAAMLSGHWVESAGNVIKLQGFSPESVMVALKHIYSGTSTVPEGVRVGELAALADMLALDGLKDVIALHLKAKMCHYFHKPCSGCLEGVLDVLPIAGAYCLDELYHRCLRWVARHFVVVLPTRNYAALPPEVQDRCLKQLLDDMSVSNVLETALGCERVLSSLPMVRWAQPVFDSAAQLLESATSFIAANMSGVLASDRFLALGRDSGWSIESLQDTMRVACELIRPDQAVLSHLQLTQLLQDSQEEGAPEVSETYLTFLETLLGQVEKFMVHNANRVAVCRKWPLLSPSVQRRIKDAALVVVEFSRPTGPRPKLSSTNRRPRGSSSEGTRTPGQPGDHRLMRSASATAVPSTQRPGTRRTPAGGQEPARCHTPPASLPRPRTHTPPPTRASTLRAQARQNAIQRSQSARTVADRPRRTRPGNDTSTDEETQSSTKRTIPTGGFTRGATFTRSLSRPDTSSSRPLPHTPTRSSGPPPSSRPRTPGPLEGSQLPRRTSVTQRTPSQTTTGSSASEDEIPHRKSSHTQRSQSLTPVHRGGNDKLGRTQSTETRCRTPTHQRTELRSSTSNLSRSGGSTTMNNLSKTGAGSTNNLSRAGGGSTNNLSRTGTGSSTNNLSRTGGSSNTLTRSAGSAALQENKPVSHQPEGNSHCPRTPRDPRKPIDVKNGNLARPRVAAQGRRSTRSPLREPGRSTGVGAGRGSSPTSSIHLSSEGRSRTSSVTSRPGGDGGPFTATPPSVGSRSNTFCKDDNTNVTRKTALP